MPFYSGAGLPPAQQQQTTGGGDKPTPPPRTPPRPPVSPRHITAVSPQEGPGKLALRDETIEIFNRNLQNLQQPLPSGQASRTWRRVKQQHQNSSQAVDAAFGQNNVVTAPRPPPSPPPRRSRDQINGQMLQIFEQTLPGSEGVASAAQGSKSESRFTWESLGRAVSVIGKDLKAIGSLCLGAITFVGRKLEECFKVSRSNKDEITHKLIDINKFNDCIINQLKLALNEKTENEDKWSKARGTERIFRIVVGPSDREKMLKGMADPDSLITLMEHSNSDGDFGEKHKVIWLGSLFKMMLREKIPSTDKELISNLQLGDVVNSGFSESEKIKKIKEKIETLSPEQLKLIAGSIEIVGLAYDLDWKKDNIQVGSMLAPLVITFEMFDMDGAKQPEGGSIVPCLEFLLQHREEIFSNTTSE